MAASFVRENTPTGSSSAVSSGAVTITAPASGNVLVACVAFGSATVGASVSSLSSTGATWTRVAQSAQNSTGTNRQEIWVGSGDTGTSVTINFSAASKWAATISEWHGLEATVDVTAVTGAPSVGAGTNTTTSTALATPGGDLIIAALNLSKSKVSTDFSSTAGAPDARTALTYVASGGTNAQNVGMQALYDLSSAGFTSQTFSWVTAAAWDEAWAAVSLRAAARSYSTAGSVTPSGATTRAWATNKALAATLQATVALKKASAKAMAVTMTAVGTVIQALIWLRTLAASLTPAVLLETSQTWLQVLMGLVTPQAAALFYEDTFTRPNQADWGIASGGVAWTYNTTTPSTVAIVSNRGVVTSAAGENGPSLVLGSAFAADREVLFTWTVSSAGSFPLLQLRTNNGDSQHVALYLSPSGGLYTDFWNGSMEDFVFHGGTWAGVTPGSYAKTRARLVGATVSWKNWVEGDPEPASFQGSHTSAVSVSGDYVGLMGSLNAGGDSMHVKSFNVIPNTGDGPAPTPALSRTITRLFSVAITAVATLSGYVTDALGHIIVSVGSSISMLTTYRKTVSKPLSSVLTPETPAAATVVRQDTFVRADQSGWGAASDGNTWLSLGNPAVRAISGNTGTLANTGSGVIVPITLLGPVLANADGDVLVRWSLQSQAEVYILCRFNLDNTQGSTLALAYDGASRNYVAGPGGAEDNTGWFSAPVPTPGALYWTRFRAVGNTYSWRTWADGASEPFSWDQTHTSTVSLPAGAAGLGAALLVADATVAYDSFSAAIVPSILQLAVRKVQAAALVVTTSVTKALVRAVPHATVALTMTVAQRRAINTLRSTTLAAAPVLRRTAAKPFTSSLTLPGGATTSGGVVGFNGYSYYTPLTLTGGGAAVTGSTSAPTTSGTDYVLSVHLTGDTAATIWGELHDTAAFSDLSVWYLNAGTWTQLDVDIDQVSNGAWSSSNLTFWFKLQANLGASPATDTTNYRLAWGNASPTVKNDWAKIYPFSDDFPGSSVDATKWNNSNANGHAATVSVAGSVATLTTNLLGGEQVGLSTVATFAPGRRVSARLTMDRTDGSNSDTNTIDKLEWGSEGLSGGATFPLIQQMATNYTFHTDVYNAGGTGWNLDTTPANTSPHIFELALTATGTGYTWFDGTLTGPSSVIDGGTAPVQLAVLQNSAPPGARLAADWVKVRPWITSEPTVSVPLTAGVVTTLAGYAHTVPLIISNTTGQTVGGSLVDSRTDSFGRPDASGDGSWGTATSGQAWTRLHSWGGLLMASGYGVITDNDDVTNAGGPAPDMTLGPAQSSDDLEVLVCWSMLATLGDTDCGPQISFTSDSPSTTGYVTVAILLNGHISTTVAQSITGGAGSGGTDNPFPSATWAGGTVGQFYWTRLRREGQRYSLRIWAQGDAEPTDWTYTGVSGYRPSARRVALQGDFFGGGHQVGFSYYNVRPLGAAAVRVYDDFVRANQGGWGTAADGGTWVTDDAGGSSLAIAQDEGTVSGTGYVMHELPIAPCTDQDILLKVKNTLGGSAGVIELRLRVSSDGLTFYYIDWSSTALTLRRYHSGSDTGVASAVVTAPAAGTWYWLRIRIQGTAIRARVWADGTTENLGNWDLYTFDSVITTSGGVRMVINPSFGTGTPTVYSLGYYMATSLDLSTDWDVSCQIGGADAATITSGCLHPDYADLAVYYCDPGGLYHQLDRDLDPYANGALSSSNVAFWIRLQQSLASAASSPSTGAGSYWLCWGHSSPGVLADLPTIYTFADDFTGVWPVPNDWTFFGGGSFGPTSGTLIITPATLSDPLAIYTTRVFGPGTEMRLVGTLPDEADWDGFGDPQVNGPRLAMASYTTIRAGNLLLSGGLGSFTTMVTRDSGTHLFVVGYGASGGAWFLQDSNTGFIGSPSLTDSMPLSLYAQGGSITAERVSVRPYISGGTEPSVSPTMSGSFSGAGPGTFTPVMPPGAQQMVVTVTAVDALTGATGSTAGYTARLRLDSTTVPTAASVFSALQTFGAAPFSGDTANYPSGYPNDLTVSYGGTQIHCWVSRCTSSQIVLDWKLQASLSGGASDSYTVSWGNSSPTVLNTLANVYLYGDNFDTGSLTGWTAVNCAATTPTGYATVTPNGSDPSGLYRTVAGTTDYDISADLRLSVAEDGTWGDYRRSGLGLRQTTTGWGPQTYAWMLHNSSGIGPQAFLEDSVAWASWGNYYGGSGLVPANTWTSMRFQIVGASPGTQRARIWDPGSAEPTAWVSNSEAGYNNAPTGSIVRLTGSSETGLVTDFRYVRVRWAVTNPPTFVLGAVTGVSSGTTTSPLQRAVGKRVLGTLQATTALVRGLLRTLSATLTPVATGANASATLSVTAGSALTGATGAGLAYTARVRLDSTTTPTAASIFYGIQSFGAAPFAGDTVNYPYGYPNDISVKYGASQIDCWVQRCTPTQVVVDWKIQANIGAGSTDTYTMAWGNPSPTVMKTLANVYLYGDNFTGASLDPGWVVQNSVGATLHAGYVSLLTSANSNVNGLVRSISGTTDLDIQADVRSSQTEVSNWGTNKRVGLGLRATSGTTPRMYNWGVRATGGVGPQAFWEDTNVFSGATNALGTATGLVSANTWTSLRFQVTGTSPGTQQAKAWDPANPEPLTWVSNPNTSYDAAPTLGSVRLTSSDETSLTLDYRYVRVRQAPATAPNVTAAVHGSIWGPRLLSMSGALVASLAPSGALLRRTAHLLATSLTLTVARVQQVSRALAASLTLQSTRTRDISVGRQGTLTASASVRRLTSHGLSALLSGTGAVLRGSTHLLTSALAATVSMMRQMVHALPSALVTSAGALQRATAQISAAAVEAVAALQTMAIKVLEAVHTLGAEQIRDTEHGERARLMPTMMLLVNNAQLLMTARIDAAAELARDTVLAPFMAAIEALGALLKDRIAFLDVAELRAGADLGRDIFTALAGALALGAEIQKEVSTFLDGSLSLAADLLHAVDTALAAGLALSGAIAERVLDVILGRARLDSDLDPGVYSQGTLGRDTVHLLGAPLALAAYLGRAIDVGLTALLAARGNAGRERKWFQDALLRLMAVLTQVFVPQKGGDRPFVPTRPRSDTLRRPPPQGVHRLVLRPHVHRLRRRHAMELVPEGDGLLVLDAEVKNLRFELDYHEDMPHGTAIVDYRVSASRTDSAEDVTDWLIVDAWQQGSSMVRLIVGNGEQLIGATYRVRCTIVLSNDPPTELPGHFDLPCIE